MKERTTFRVGGDLRISFSSTSPIPPSSLPSPEIHGVTNSHVFGKFWVGN